MQMIDYYRRWTSRRDNGEACPLEHEWRSMDDVAMTYFIPEDLRKMYWMTLTQHWKEAYIAAATVKDRLLFLPYLWRLPKRLNVGKGRIVPMEALVQMVQDSKDKFFNDKQKGV